MKMKAKYYLRGMGLGIIVTSLIFLIAGLFYKPQLSEDEIIIEAKKLGMVMEESGTDAKEADPEKEDGKEAGGKTEDESQNTEDGSDKTEDDGKGTKTGSEADDENDQNTVEDEENRQGTDGEEESEQTIGGEETEGNGQTTGSAGEEQNAAGSNETDYGASNGETRGLTIEAGENAADVCRDLQLSGAISDAEAFRQYLGAHGYASYLQPGTYEIPSDSSFEEIAKIVTQNKIQ